MKFGTFVELNELLKNLKNERKLIFKRLNEINKELRSANIVLEIVRNKNKDLGKEAKKPFTKEVFETVLSAVTQPIEKKKPMLKKLVNGKVKYFRKEL